MSAVPGFGEPASATLAPALDSARIAAGDAAFAAVAWVTALLCVLSAAAAWISVPGRGDALAEIFAAAITRVGCLSLRPWRG